jgi:hypothetical protein
MHFFSSFGWETLPLLWTPSQPDKCGPSAATSNLSAGLRVILLIFMIIRFFASRSISFMEIGSNSTIPALFRSAVFQPLTCGKFAYWQKSLHIDFYSFPYSDGFFPYQLNLRKRISGPSESKSIRWSLVDSISSQIQIA